MKSARTTLPSVATIGAIKDTFLDLLTTLAKKIGEPFGSPFRVSRYFPQRRVESSPLQNRHLDYVRRPRRRSPSNRSSEVFIQWEKRIGPQFSKNSSKPFLNSVDFVEKIAPLHLQLPAAQFPIGA